MANVLLSSIVLGPYILGLTLVSALDPDPLRPEKGDGGGGGNEAVLEDRSFPLDELDDVEIDLVAGDLTLRGGAASAVAVRVLDADLGPSCRFEVRRDGRTVEIESRHDGLPSRCTVDLEIIVPGALPVEIDLGAGNVVLDGLAGDLEIDVGAGDVRGAASGSDVAVATGAGDIELDRLVGAVEAKTGTGGVTLRFDATPRGAIEATTGVGDVAVQLPAGAVVDVSASTGLGSVHQGLTERDGAETVVRASTGVGDVQLTSN